MGIIRCANVDGIDVLTLNEFAPVGFVGTVAPFFGKGFDFFLVAAADGLADWDVIGVEEM